MLLLRCRGGGIGRRTGLKIPRWKQRAGSIPAPGTSDYSLRQTSTNKLHIFYRLQLFLFLVSITHAIHQHTQLILSVAPDGSHAFSTEVPQGINLRTRSHVFTNKKAWHTDLTASHAFLIRHSKPQTIIIRNCILLKP
jgi:hypothetical protein